MRKTIYCTLDTETVGGAANPTGMYNLGCVIHDKDGNIFATTSMLVMEHYNDINKDEYSKNNFHIYNDTAVCGTRGWICPNEIKFDESDKKVYKRVLEEILIMLEWCNNG